MGQQLRGALLPAELKPQHVGWAMLCRDIPVLILSHPTAWGEGLGCCSHTPTPLPHPTAGTLPAPLTAPPGRAQPLRPHPAPASPTLRCHRCCRGAGPTPDPGAVQLRTHPLADVAGLSSHRLLFFSPFCCSNQLGKEAKPGARQGRGSCPALSPGTGVGDEATRAGARPRGPETLLCLAAMPRRGRCPRGSSRPHPGALPGSQPQARPRGSGQGEEIPVGQTCPGAGRDKAMFVPEYKEAGPAPRPGATYSDGRGRPAIPAFTGVQRPAPALATLPAGVRGATPPLDAAGG